MPAKCAPLNWWFVAWVRAHARSPLGGAKRARTFERKCVAMERLNAPPISAKGNDNGN